VDGKKRKVSIDPGPRGKKSKTSRVTLGRAHACTQSSAKGYPVCQPGSLMGFGAQAQGQPASCTESKILGRKACLPNVRPAYSAPPLASPRSMVFKPRSTRRMLAPCVIAHPRTCGRGRMSDNQDTASRRQELALNEERCENARLQLATCVWNSAEVLSCSTHSNGT
jgi:hypothetical protein